MVITVATILWHLLYASNDLSAVLTFTHLNPEIKSMGYYRHYSDLQIGRLRHGGLAKLPKAVSKLGFRLWLASGSLLIITIQYHLSKYMLIWESMENREDLNKNIQISHNPSTQKLPLLIFLSHSIKQDFICIKFVCVYIHWCLFKKKEKDCAVYTV